MKRYSEEEKRMWVEDWKESGTGRYTYAKRNGLNPATLKNWVREAEGPQDFVEIKPPMPVPMGCVPEILIEKGDKPILLICDRGYMSLEFVQFLEEKGINYLIRLRTINYQSGGLGTDRNRL